MGLPAEAKAAPTGAAIHSGTRHDVMCLEVRAFCETGSPDRFISKAKARTVSGRNARFEAAWGGRALNGNGSVLVFCEE